MSQVEKLLQYQKEDSRLLKIEQEVHNSEEYKNYIQTRKFLKQAPEKLDALDAKARSLASTVEELSKKYEEVRETLTDFESIDELIDGGADIAFYKKNLTQITETIKAIRSEINAIYKQIKAAQDEYQSMKKKTIAMQKQYEEYSKIYKAYSEEKKKEMAEVQKVLDEIKKDIEPQVMQGYQTKRSERVFPILCPEKNGRCSICGSELSLSFKEKISGGGVVECDNCHRYVYKE